LLPSDCAKAALWAGTGLAFTNILAARVTVAGKAAAAGRVDHSLKVSVVYIFGAFRLIRQAAIAGIAFYSLRRGAFRVAASRLAAS